MDEHTRGAGSTLRASAARPIHGASGDGTLAGCERLKPRTFCESTYLTQVVPLLRRRPKTCRFIPVTLPTQDLGKLCALQRQFVLMRRMQLIDIWSDQRIQKENLPLLHIEKALQVVTRKEKTGASRFKRLTRTQRDAVIAAAKDRAESANRRNGVPLGDSAGMSSSMRESKASGSKVIDIIDQIQGVIADLPVPLPDESKPAIGFRVDYRQDWCSRGYRRGRVVRSVPLPADGRKEISVKSWTVRKNRREENESVARDISTEIVGDEKWSHATTKQLSAELNQSMDANLKASGEAPVKGVTVGAEAGAGSQTSGSVAGSITDSEERIHQATLKSVDLLKTKLSSTVETSEEIGLEATTTETIVNPNKCNALTYHFFEVVELFDVTTRVHEITPVVLVALPSPTVTPEWLLCHECLLKPRLPCESLYAGFDAARTVLARAKLGEFVGALEGEHVEQAADFALGAMRDVLGAYLALKTARAVFVPAADGGNIIEQGWEAVEQFAEGVADAVGDFVEGAVDGASEAIESAAEAAGDVVEAIGEGLQALGSSFLPIMAMSNSTAPQYAPGGLGSFIYWRVAGIAAPELGTSLAALHAAYNQIADMPAGPAKTNAAMAALASFYRSLGDIDEVFNRINTGLAVVAVGLAATTFAGAVAVVGFIAAVGTVGMAAAAILLGAAAIASLGELVILIVAMLAGDPGIDIVPDDEGLKDAIAALHGQFQQLGHAAELPAPPQSDDPAEHAEYQKQLQEANQRRRELAEAQVALDALTCHITANRSHYAQVYWESVSAADLARILRDDFGIPDHFVQPRIAGFADGRAAFPVANLRWLRLSGFKIDVAMEELRASEMLNVPRQRSGVEAPTRGLTVEPEIGECNACDEYIRFHRARDMELKTEEVEQTRIETRRLQERINMGLLGDPTPYEGAASVSVTTTHADEPTPAPADNGD
jgi:hypothetical protein